MAEMPDDDFIKRAAKAHGMSQANIRDMIKNNNNWESLLDKQAFNNAKGNIKNKALGEAGDIDLKNMRHLDSKGINSYVNMKANDAAKDSGERLYGYGEKSGWGTSVKQASQASRGERFKTFLQHANFLGASSRGSFADSIGATGANTKALAAKGSIMSKVGRRVLGPGMAAVAVNDSLQSEDPLNNYLTFAGAGWGLQQGWKTGKAAADVIKPTALLRTPIGAVAAIGSAVVVGGGTWALGDLGKSDSTIAKKAKSFYKKETMASNKATNESLTMRSAAFNKLSSSSLNNRSQLLGNEADILKNAQY